MNKFDEREELVKLRDSLKRKKSMLKKNETLERDEAEELISRIAKLLVGAGVAIVVMPKIEESVNDFVKSSFDKYDRDHKKNRRYALPGGKEYLLNTLENIVDFAISLI